MTITDVAPHQHCRCGARLVGQPPDGLRVGCSGCGFFPSQCICTKRACEVCGREPSP
jgi:hypothetical protein